MQDISYASIIHVICQEEDTVQDNKAEEIQEDSTRRYSARQQSRTRNTRG
jgi:hypothetical protein